MSMNRLILVGDTAEQCAAPFVDQVLACWPEGKRPQPITLTVEEATKDDAIFDQCRVAWFVLNGRDPAQLHELIARVQDRHCPAVITRDNETESIGAPFQDGVVVAPPSAPPVAVCAMLRTLWNQCDSIRALLMEIEILNAHNGGLATQFDKIDEELRLAAQLQREFLPTELPSMENVDFRVLFRPASYVSGDIYDVIRLDDHHMGFFVADAVGHGVPAALMTVYIKRSLRTGKRMSDSAEDVRLIPPDEALAHLNRDMVRQQSGNVRFATACYGIINTETYELTFARAGHPYPLLMRTDGTSEWLESEGGLLGIFPDETFDVATVQLRPGDRFLIYSDGFEVAFPTEPQAGKVRKVANDVYTQVFHDMAHGTLDEAFAMLARRLDEQTGSLNQMDDLTALLIELK